MKLFKPNDWFILKVQESRHNYLYKPGGMVLILCLKYSPSRGKFKITKETSGASNWKEMNSYIKLLKLQAKLERDAHFKTIKSEEARENIKNLLEL